MRKLILTLIFLLSCAPLGAHDFWIEPSTYHPARGVMFTTSLRVGRDFSGDPVPRSATQIDSFVLRNTTGTQAVNGLENRDPAGYVRIDAPGVAVIGYRSKPTPLELPRAKFEQFLTEEGLEQAVPNSARQQELHREQFFRYAKSLVRVGDDSSRSAPPLGYRLELVPLTDPFAAGPLVLRVVFEGRVLRGQLVTAIPRDHPSKRIQVRSNAHGEVSMPLISGVWLIKTTSIVPAPVGSPVEWETLWASLTFER